MNNEKDYGLGSARAPSGLCPDFTDIISDSRPAGIRRVEHDNICGQQIIYERLSSLLLEPVCQAKNYTNKWLETW